MQRQDRTGHWAHTTRHGAQATRVAELYFNARGINVTHDRVTARVNPHIDHDRARRYVLATHQAAYAGGNHEYGGGTGDHPKVGRLRVRYLDVCPRDLQEMGHGSANDGAAPHHYGWSPLQWNLIRP